MTEKKGRMRWEEEEEKKESSPRKPVSGGVSKEAPVVEKTKEGLPEEVLNKKYSCERELRLDLEKLGRDDLQIVLDKQGFAAWREMPGEAHRGVIHVINGLLNQWTNGRLISGQKEANVFVNDSYSSPKREKRCPDFAIYGPDRVQGLSFRKVSGKYMNPHVIIQFSWTNDIIEEALAMDDMMNYAGVGEYNALGRPTTAYLIKALRRGKAADSPVYGFNVFQVNQDQETPIEPTMKYRCGAQEDTEINIAAAAMGVEGDEGEPFTIRMQVIRQELEELDIVFVAAEENEM